MKKNLIIHVQGRVQGVFYRLAAKELALSLGLAGVARNEPDGGVSMEVEGEAGPLERFVEWCRRGPEQSTVKSLDIRDGQVRGLKDFIIR